MLNWRCVDKVSVIQSYISYSVGINMWVNRGKNCVTLAIDIKAKSYYYKVTSS